VARTERLLARTAALSVAALAVPALALAWLLEGSPGVYGAAAGLGLVFVLFCLSALAQAWAARFGSTVLLAVVIGGVGLRLMLYLATLQMLSGVAGLHRPSLAIATAAAFVLTLTLEMRLVARTPSFFWVQVPAHDAVEGAAR
jgi:hypothetical protein